MFDYDLTKYLNLTKYLINIDEQEDHEKIQRWKKGIRFFLKILAIFALGFTVFCLFLLLYFQISSGSK